MKFKKPLLYALCLLLAANPACTDDFMELAQNPNASEFALPQTLLAPAITTVLKRNMDRAQRINNELMQVHINMGDVEGKIFRYDIRSNESTSMWNNWYIQLANFKDVYKGGAERTRITSSDLAGNTYKGIGLICQVWVTSLITDMYGDAPYSEASMGKDRVFLPKFDTQRDIYADMFLKLEEANTLLTTAPNLPAAEVSADPVYDGVAANWRKLGNSMYLRLLLRLSNKASEPMINGMTAMEKFREIVETKATTYPIMAANADGARITWTGTAPYDNPFATWRPADWYDVKYTQFFINNLKEWSDPRLPIWATISNGEFEGIPGGYPMNMKVTPRSQPVTTLASDNRLGNIMTFAETQFILAEAAARGWITTPAKTYYEAGITNAITQWNATVPANYVTKEELAWDDALALEDKLEKIHLQKYYALFYTDFQQWYEYRRTGHPILPVGQGHENGGKMPSRMIYPIVLQSTNKNNLDAAIANQGPDNINTLVWWQRP
ncbi:SusD/RagB family nutrient-binding outer membrane lipoprotein [Rufibacter immobilis]|uniref:SusD/RagB family nutrient-binding outer membrane lipoprotein n=1 Tax=Rufibacter immobilis TaxID=1348778 RepID=UPI0035EA2DDA